MVCGVLAHSEDEALSLALRTLANVEKSAQRPAMAAELTTLSQRLSQQREATARAALEKLCSRP
jgi:hypothetical protein